jgi:hypothetical protein
VREVLGADDRVVQSARLKVAGVVPLGHAHEARGGGRHVHQRDPARGVARAAVRAKARLAAEAARVFVAVRREAGLAGGHPEAHPVEGERVAGDALEQRPDLRRHDPSLVEGHDEAGRPTRRVDRLRWVRVRVPNPNLGLGLGLGDTLTIP